MHKIFLPIDTKSLYQNIFNDNLKGHTCTVATPIKQGNSINKELENIYKIPEQVDFQAYPELIIELQKNSKSIVKINNVFIFENIKVNGIPIQCDARFCMFTKEEIDPTRVQFGRIKLHYPLNLKYDDLNIDNKLIIKTISELLHNYAFVVKGFEYDFDTRTLNFVATIVGYEKIPYSKVFINNKGVGSKFSKAASIDEDSYDLEIVALRKKYGEEVNSTKYPPYMQDGLERAIDLVKNALLQNGAMDIEVISSEYPYSLFDIQYCLFGVIHFCLVKTTYTSLTYFNLSSEEYRFLNMFSNSEVAFVSRLFDSEKIDIYNSRQLDHFKNEIRQIRFLKKEE